METTNGVPSQLRKVVLPAGQSPQGEHIFRRPGFHLAQRYSLLMNQGGDGLSGVHALMYKEELRLNLIL